MAYSFNFDLSRMSQNFFKDVARFSEKRGVHTKMGNFAKRMVDKFRFDDITGLPVSDSVTVIQDLVDMNVKNLSQRDAFDATDKRAVLLPHCCRKYMDSRCKAKFDTKSSSYVCMHCTPSCMVNKATKLAKKKGYDVFVLPGGSGIRKLVQSRKYDAFIGVACTEEIKLGTNILEQLHIPTQGVPLLKNGCSNTVFNLATLEKTM